MTDWQLLTQYTTQGDPAALESLIRRHADFVYATATRLTSSADAPDITQAVFILLTKKAPKIPHRGTLIGWLHHTTRLCAANLRRIQSRRRRHEREAAMSRPESISTTLPSDLSTHLDAALTRLSPPDRDLLLLRFLQNKTYAEAAAELSTTEEAARKRATRALEKLRTLLTPRIELSALTPLLATHAAINTPPALLSSLVALPHGAAMSTAATSLANAVSRALQLAKLQLASVALAAMLLFAATAFVLNTKLHPADTIPQSPQATFITAAPPPLAVPFKPVSPLTVGPIQIVKWSVLLRTPAAEQIKKICTLINAPQTTWYTPMQADGETLLKTVHDELATGDALLERPGDPLHFQNHSDERSVAYAFPDLYFHRPTYILGSRQQLAIQFNGMGRAGAAPSRTGITFSLDFPTLDCRVSGATPRTTIHPAIICTADLAAGQALAFLGNFADAHHPELSELVVWQTFRAPNTAMPLFESLTSTSDWLNAGGPTALLEHFRQSQQWNVSAAATPAAPNPKWTRTLSDGRTLTLLAVGRPQQFPACWWTPDGQPIAGADHWSDLTRGQNKPLALVLLLHDPSKPPLPPGNTRRVDHIVTDSQGTSATFGCDEDASLTVNTGTGPWQDAGPFTNKEKISVNGIPITPTLQDDSDDPPAITSVHFNKIVPDTELAVQLTDTAGKTYGELAPPAPLELADEPAPYQSDFFVPFKSIASAHLRYRQRELITFDSFAKKPLVQPPSPAADPAPRAAMADINTFLFDFVDAANAGDPAKLLPFFAVSTDAEKQMAQYYIAAAQLARAAESRFGKAAGQNPVWDGGFTPLEFDLAADWEIHPTEAHALYPGHLKLTRQNNRWLIAVSLPPAWTPPQRRQFTTPLLVPSICFNHSATTSTPTSSQPPNPSRKNFAPS